MSGSRGPERKCWDMTIQEFYGELGVDYSTVLSRLMKDSLVIRLVRRYAQDKNYGLLCEGVETGDQKKAFEASHTLKGIALNLGFEDLAEASSQMTEAMRSSFADNAQELLAPVTQAQEKLMDMIGQIED